MKSHWIAIVGPLRITPTRFQLAASGELGEPSWTCVYRGFWRAVSKRHFTIEISVCVIWAVANLPSKRFKLEFIEAGRRGTMLKKIRSTQDFQKYHSRVASREASLYRSDFIQRLNIIYYTIQYMYMNLRIPGDKYVIKLCSTCRFREKDMTITSASRQTGMEIVHTSLELLIREVVGKLYIFNQLRSIINIIYIITL